MMKKGTSSVTLRRRPTSDGGASLYLDIYDRGRRRTESLHLHLLPDRGRADREANRETMRAAEAVRDRVATDLRDGRLGIAGERPRVTLFEYFGRLCEERYGDLSNGNWGNWRSCLKHLREYEKDDTIELCDITPGWVAGFREWLDKSAVCRGGRPLSRNSKESYLRKLKACLRQAHEEGLTDGNPLSGVKGFGEDESRRMYLTSEEVGTLAATPCPSESVRRAFLFSCLTGLRRGDILKLTWGEVHEQGGYTRLIFRQRKTGGQEYLDINRQAAALMGERGKPGEFVFRRLPHPSETNTAIRLWVARAGIGKDITFHCGRHTFAVMMLELGADIYTTSKLLGHRSVATTQIYAKVLDKTKRDAVQRIPDFGL